MNKTCWRFYGGLIVSQEKWLNKMAADGYRLIRTTKAKYEFQQCHQGQYQYRVEFIGQKSKENGEDYANFLENCGYCVFFKNVNLNYSFGKVQGRPWADRGGRIATNSTTYNRELLIVEKESNGKEFELHTTFEDKQQYCKNMRKPWLFLFLVSAILGIIMRQIVWGAFAVVALAGLIAYQVELRELKRNARIKEW